MNATLTFDYLRPAAPVKPRHDLTRWEQVRSDAKIRDRLIVAMMAESRTCPLCGVTMDPDGLLRHRPRLVGPLTDAMLVCCECFARLKADCERRSTDNGGIIPMPIDVDGPAVEGGGRP